VPFIKTGYNEPMTNPFKISGLVLASILVTSAVMAPMALAQTAAPMIAAGQRVVDPEGRLLGSVERIIADGTGKPSQVVIRTVTVRGGSPSALKVLPLAAFMASDKPTTPPTLVAPLAREEIDLLPNAQ
jgi:hypothetical protein